MAKVRMDRLPRLTQEMLAHWDEFGPTQVVGAMKREDLAAFGETYEQKLNAWTVLHQQEGIAASERDEAGDILYHALIRYRDGIKSMTGRDSISSQRLPTVTESHKSAAPPDKTNPS